MRTSHMKYSIVYSTQTGNTAMLVEKADDAQIHGRIQNFDMAFSSPNEENAHIRKRLFAGRWMLFQVEIIKLAHLFIG